MTPDPNWFYSSIAQCAAAIIGLLGAILATRLQQQLSDSELEHNTLLSLFYGLREQLKKSIRKILC